MSVILQIYFPFSGPFGSEMSDSMLGLAESINQEPGFIWKICTENPATQRAGSIYLFDNETNARTYLTNHTQRLVGFGISDIQAQCFAYNPVLSSLNKASFLD